MGEVTQDTIHTPHTPGPWYALGTRVYSSGDQGEIAVATKADPTHRSAAPANAILIAAAPDLLAELTESYVALLVTLSIQQRLGAQYLLVRILNSIARASGRTPQEVQEECESRAALTRAEGRAE